MSPTLVVLWLIGAVVLAVLPADRAKGLRHLWRMAGELMDWLDSW